jgi:aspartyl-tRNA(Asn)/glutamyl-tRNA(Gln) amidotransferase subunit A
MSTGRLADVKFAVEDNILVLGRGTMAIGEMLKDFKSPLQATAVDRLEAEGAVLIGAADKATFTLGVDTGGEVRELAAQNGSFGYKPTYGMISRHGIVDMASSMDTIGAMAHSIADIKLACSVMAGPDEHDSTVYKQEAGSKKQEVKKIGLIKEFKNDDANELVKKLRQTGYEVDEVNLPMAKYAMAIYHTVMPAEVSSNFMRYDGIRYGKRPADAKTLTEIYSKSRGEGFNDEIKRRIMMGYHVLSTENFESHFMQASRARTMLINELSELFGKYDFLVGAASLEIMNVSDSLAGLPALVMPNRAQIIGPMKSDEKLLNFAEGLE